MSIPVPGLFKYLWSLMFTPGVGGLFIVLMDLTAQLCHDEQGINGMPGWWWDASALRIPRFPVTQLEKPGKSLVLIPVSLWQQWRGGSVRGADCQRGIEWRRREWRETHWKIGEGEDWEKRIEKLIALFFCFFFFCWSWGGRICWFSAMAFYWRTACYIHATWGAGTNVIPCSALTKCTNLSPRADISHTVRSSERIGVRLFLASDSSHLCLGPFVVVFNDEEACWLLSPSQILIWTNTRHRKWCCYF